MQPAEPRQTVPSPPVPEHSGQDRSGSSWVQLRMQIARQVCSDGGGRVTNLNMQLGLCADQAQHRTDRARTEGTCFVLNAAPEQRGA